MLSLPAGIWTRILALVPGFFVGLTLHFAILWIVPALFPVVASGINMDRQYSGVVSEQNASSITLTVPSKFPDGNPAPMRFALAADTVWYSMEYQYEDGIVVSRKTSVELSRPLPPGTYVSVLRDFRDDDPFRVMAVVFLRKTGV